MWSYKRKERKKRGMKERKGGRKDERKDEKEEVATFKLQFLLVGNYFSEVAGEQSKCVPHTPSTCCPPIGLFLLCLEPVLMNLCWRKVQQDTGAPRSGVGTTLCSISLGEKIWAKTLVPATHHLSAKAELFLFKYKHYKYKQYKHLHLNIGIPESL